VEQLPTADGAGRQSPGVQAMNIATILLIILVLMFVGVLPTWPHSVSWGYYPSGGLGILLLIVILLLVTGRI
jgi:hypothetical protein